jgi:hypothetical protein
MEILEAGGLASADCGELRIEGRDPILATPFRAGEVAAVALGLSGVAAAELWRRRTGQAQQVQVDVRRAAAHRRRGDRLHHRLSRGLRRAARIGAAR